MKKKQLKKVIGQAAASLEAAFVLISELKQEVKASEELTDDMEKRIWEQFKELNILRKENKELNTARIKQEEFVQELHVQLGTQLEKIVKLKKRIIKLASPETPIIKNWKYYIDVDIPDDDL